VEDENCILENWRGHLHSQKNINISLYHFRGALSLRKKNTFEEKKRRDLWDSSEDPPSIKV